jgi:hypothetical protein
MKCKQKRPINGHYFVKTRFNKSLVKGLCAECNTKVSGLVSKDFYDREMAKKSFEQQPGI